MKKITEKEVRDIIVETVMEALTKQKTDKVPTTLYHVSNPANRKSILKNGLLPKVGDSYSAHYEGENELEPVVFLSSKNNYDSTWDDDRWEIDVNQINPQKLFRDFDRNMKNCYVYTDVIPPTALRMVYKGSGNSLEESIDSSKITVVAQDGNISFNYGQDNIGGLVYSVGYPDEIENEYSDTIYDFNPGIMRMFNQFSQIVNIEDIWVNREFRGKGLFRAIMEKGMQVLTITYSQFILRACSDNGFPEDKLVEIYQDFYFTPVQDTEGDGVIMIRK